MEPDLFAREVTLYKKKSGEFNIEYRTTFYKSFDERKYKLPNDVIELSKLGFAMTDFGPVKLCGEYIGHIVTFVKK